MTQQDSSCQTSEYDSPWKEIMRFYFKEFISFFLPVAYEEIDWQRPPEFLDKELDRITKEAKGKNRRVDLLVKVWLLGGDELWILIHVEIQGDRDPEFEERMYTSQHRAYDLYHKPVIGLAILADEDASWRVSEYRRGMFGSEVVYKFNTVKLLDYLDRLEALEASDNPFAVVTVAHLAAKQTKNQVEDRLRVKSRIIRGLYQRGFTRQQILDLFRFIDWILSLPKDADQRFWQELSTFEEMQKMSYITSVERIGMEKGMLIGEERGMLIGEARGEARGEKKGKTEMLLDLLQDRFGIVPDWVSSKLAEADLETLKRWSKRILGAERIEQIFQ
ncbi:MAG: cytosolic protein [Magnetococcales bacterium]|nr:cytosolic protein [Magnetococcales bacterium]